MFSLRTLTTLLSLTTLTLAYPSHHFPRSTNSTGNSTDLDETPGSGGSWNIIVDNDDPRTLDELLSDAGLNRTDLKYVWENAAFKGFSGSLSSHCANKMSTMSGIKHFEPEMDVKLHDFVTDGTWGLQRISQEDTIDGTFRTDEEIASWNFTYQFNGSKADLGKGVDIYIIDTGVNVDHQDFDGRASWGFAFDDDFTDPVGHGTHCAGTAASSTFGVAKAANIIAVKVLSDETGTSSDIINGIDWVITQHAKRSQESDFVGSVASMSLGSSTTSNTLEDVVLRANQAGIHFSVAAGNENQNACNASPAGVNSITDSNGNVESQVISVGAINILDNRSSFSNWGTCVDVYAPGELVTSTWIGGTDVINTISGTSMACPHVTGLIAYALALNPSLATDVEGMKTLLTETMSLDITLDVSSLGKTVLANNGFLTEASK